MDVDVDISMDMVVDIATDVDMDVDVDGGRGCILVVCIPAGLYRHVQTKDRRSLMQAGHVDSAAMQARGGVPPSFCANMLLQAHQSVKAGQQPVNEC